MPDWLNYKGIQVPDATPTGEAGLYLKDDLLALADRAPNKSASNPSSTDDSSKGYFAGSHWFNTSTEAMWVCVDAAVNAAAWRAVYRITENALILAPGGSPWVPRIQFGTGGDARGDEAVDLQRFRGSDTQVASGPHSFIAGGGYNTASGYYSHAEGASTTASQHGSHSEGVSTVSSGYYAHAEGVSTTASGNASHAEGRNSVASGTGAHAGGERSKAILRGQWARAAGGHSNQTGTAQTTITQLFRRSTDDSATELTLDGNTPLAPNRFTVADGQTLSCLINLVGRKEDGGANDHASFLRQVCIRREGSTTALVGSVQTVGTDINPASWGGVAITADDSVESLKIEVTGAASTNIRWMATVIASEVADAAI